MPDMRAVPRDGESKIRRKKKRETSRDGGLASRPSTVDLYLTVDYSD